MFKKIVSVVCLGLLLLPVSVRAGSPLMTGEEDQSEYVELGRLSELANLGAGEKVLVRGVVSVGYSVLEDGRLWLQDDSGGLSVKFGDDPGVEVGDELEVLGEVQELSYRLVVQVEDFEVIGSGGWSEIVINAENLMSYKDRLVKFRGEYDRKESNSYFLTDETGEIKMYLKDRVEIDLPKIEKGQLMEVVGLVDEISSGYRLLPTSGEDIILVANENGSESELLPSTGFDWWGLLSNFYRFFYELVSKNN